MDRKDQDWRNKAVIDQAVAVLSAAGCVVLSPNVLRDFADDPAGMMVQIRAIQALTVASQH